MATLAEEYNEWNTPIVGAYLLWRFASEYVECHPGHQAPSFLHLCIVSVLLRWSVYSNEIPHAKSLHAYAARFIKKDKDVGATKGNGKRKEKEYNADRLEAIHYKIKELLPFTLKSVNMAVSRKLLVWDVDNARLEPLKIGKLKPGTSLLSKTSVQKLGNHAATLAKWMASLELSTIAFDLGVKF